MDNSAGWMIGTCGIFGFVSLRKQGFWKPTSLVPGNLSDSGSTDDNSAQAFAGHVLSVQWICISDFKRKGLKEICIHVFQKDYLGLFEIVSGKAGLR